MSSLVAFSTNGFSLLFDIVQSGNGYCSNCPTAHLPKEMETNNRCGKYSVPPDLLLTYLFNCCNCCRNLLRNRWKYSFVWCLCLILFSIYVFVSTMFNNSIVYSWQQFQFFSFSFFVCKRTFSIHLFGSNFPSGVRAMVIHFFWTLYTSLVIIRLECCSRFKIHCM